MFISINNSLEKLRGKLRSFAGDSKGVAALEFAFIAPILITMYLGTQEVSLALQMNKKVGRSASAIGDLIAQKDTSITNNDLQDIMKVGTATLQPYSITLPTITVTGIQVSAGGAATVAWSKRLSGGSTYSVPFGVGSAVANVPAKLLTPSTFLVKVQTQLEYKPITAWSLQRNKGSGASAYAAIDMSETYYLRPRNTDTLTCTGC